MDAIEQMMDSPAQPVAEQENVNASGEEALIEKISEWIHLDVDRKAISAVLWAIWSGRLENEVAKVSKNLRDEYSREREDVDGIDSEDEHDVEPVE